MAFNNTVPDASFRPNLSGYSGQGAFRFWCQKVLPLVYDDSLSYYELLNKVVVYLNNTIADVASAENNIDALNNAYIQLENYVNSYFNSLDVQNEINNKLDAMVNSGEFDELLSPVVAEQIDDVVGEQIGNTVASQISGTVANQIGDVVDDQLVPLANQIIPPSVTSWLNENVDPVGSAVVVDSTLTISGAAADSEATGVAIDEITEYSDNILWADREQNKTENGLTIKIEADGTIYINGTATDDTFIPMLGGANRDSAVLPIGSYMAVGYNVGGSISSTAANAISLRCGTRTNVGASLRAPMNNFSITADARRCFVNITNGITFTNFRIRYAIFSGSSAYEYEPHKTAYDIVTREKSEANEEIAYSGTGTFYPTYYSGDFNNSTGEFTVGGTHTISDMIDAENILSVANNSGTTHLVAVAYYDYANGIYTYAGYENVVDGAIYEINHEHTHIRLYAYDFYSNYDTVVVKTKSYTYKIRDRMDELENKYLDFTPHFEPLVDAQYSRNIGVIGISHRGYHESAPENNIPAYKAAVALGYNYAETDIWFTADNIPVCVHNRHINQDGARNPDGSEIDTPANVVNVDQLTLAQLNAYDWGIYKGSQYAGLGIMTLENFLRYCKRSGLYAFLEIKGTEEYINFTDAQLKSIVTLVNACGMKNSVSYFSFREAYIKKISEYDSTARVGVSYNSHFDTTEIARLVANLRTGSNEVFVLSYYKANAEVNACADNGVPMMVYTIDNANEIINMNKYISGVLSNTLIASRIVYNAENS